jgi:regulator of sigma E protease
MLIINILIFVFILGFLIFTHELCHFIAAKRAKARVEEFCIGFPPRIYKIKKRGTLYSLGIIPFGGFVKIYGEDPGEKGKGSFYRLKFSQRFWIIAAGVISNFLVAVILFAIVYFIGYPQAIEGKTPPNAKDVAVQIILISEDSPAEAVGLKIGDRIISLSTENITVEPKEIEDVQNFTKANLGKKATITIQRGEEIIQKNIKLREDYPENEGSMGVMLAKTGIIEYSLLESVVMGIKTTYRYTRLTFWAVSQMIKDAISGTKTPGLELSGPIGAGGLFVELANLGFIYIINFTAILSLSLAIFNSLPFPALDGGRLLFLGIEKVKKKPVKPEIEQRVNQVGLAILVILMILITVKDVRGLF